MKCVIVDDEPLAHQVLEHYIAQTPGLQHAASFRNAFDAFEYLGKNNIDLLFLDIEMPLVNGINFLKALPNPPKTIFTTAYKQYAYEGFELDAVDYLLKPFAYERFVKAIQKAKTDAEPAPESSASTLTIKDKQGLLVLKQQEIMYVEGCRDYVKIITAQQTHIIYHTLKGILEKLNPEIFVQSHRSYIVNKAFINRIVQDNIILQNQSFIPVGQLYKKGLLQQING
ncbi:LytTR family DNA-binding domain-containing protein [Mucilaginibacter sp. BJC16-A38]|uniref:LytR/AlgR family response regulator transcription factor n=1 Tax=Mucilaginibacter phenanthrenivorans TaxID=1234842 RepID=UPI0021581846|nr:LytTR family DNA-binding domain-containing protein [Mucilaginibacter phenanthrenivorans]MCR8559521.1 LytTR family DNA-binding domain-containing protein [Mucilaginibacter phenanthrenivorans]